MQTTILLAIILAFPTINCFHPTTTNPHKPSTIPTIKALEHYENLKDSVIIDDVYNDQEHEEFVKYTEELKKKLAELLHQLSLITTTPEFAKLHKALSTRGPNGKKKTTQTPPSFRPEFAKFHKLLPTREPQIKEISDNSALDHYEDSDDYFSFDDENKVAYNTLSLGDNENTTAGPDQSIMSQFQFNISTGFPNTDAEPHYDTTQEQTTDYSPYDFTSSSNQSDYAYNY